MITPLWLSGPLLSYSFLAIWLSNSQNPYTIWLLCKVRNPEGIQIPHWPSDILFLIWYENGMQIITKTKVKNKSSLERSRLLTFPNRLRVPRGSTCTPVSSVHGIFQWWTILNVRCYFLWGWPLMSTLNLSSHNIVIIWLAMVARVI